MFLSTYKNTVIVCRKEQMEKEPKSLHTKEWRNILWKLFNLI